MGRKLSFSEADAFNEAGASLQDGKRGVSLSSSLELQARIAEALGLPAAGLRRPVSSPSTILEVAGKAQLAEITMSRDCLDLIEAYSKITDREERQRLLKIVRDAAHRHTES